MNKGSYWLAFAIAIVIGVGSFYFGNYVSGSEFRSVSKVELSKAQNEFQIASNQPIVSRSDADSAFGLYYNVLSMLKSKYVESKDASDENKLAHGTVRGMLGHLKDPVNRFYEKEDAETFMLMENGTFKGLGAVTAMNHRKVNGIDEYALEVLSVFPGSPAEKAGLRCGDVIDAINNQWVMSYSLADELEPLRKAVRAKKMTQKDFVEKVKAAQAKQDTSILVSEALKIINNPSAEPVKLTIKRSGVEKPLEVTYTSSEFNAETVIFRQMPNDTAYIRIFIINNTTSNTLNNALSKINTNAKGIIIDLRETSGGTIEEMLAIISNFLPSETLAAQLEQKKGDAVKRPLKVLTGNTYKIPITVLVNHGTYNAAEIIAAALKERAGAVIVGEPTYGDPMVRSKTTLLDGSMFIMAVGKYFTSKGADISETGVQPDVLIPTRGDYGDLVKDAALIKAIEIVQKGGVAQ